MSEFLRNVPLFADLSEADLDHLCELAREVKLAPGEQLFAEGDQGDAAYVIETGELEILKMDGGKDVLLAVRATGDVIGEMSLLEDAPRMASARARGDATVLAVAAQAFEDVLQSSSGAARAMLHTVVARWRGTEARLRQSEKMAQLGTLAAGLAHELNNPAAAVQRGAASLTDLDERAQKAERDLLATGVDAAQRAVLEGLDGRARVAAGKPDELDSLTRSDREAEIEEQLDEHDIDDAWEVAPSLVNVGLTSDDLSKLLEEWGDRSSAMLGWLGLVYGRAAVVAEIHQGAKRISELVRSLKMYAYLDQAPVQEVDIHEGLDSTLVLLRSKLKKGVEVVRQYDETLPHIHGYGSELNQVWTNLMANSIDAMEGEGTITIRTRSLGSAVEIELEDNGSGIPEEIQKRIFDPFFTTKPPGKGTGLGLDICYNIVANKHKGTLSVSSQPGRTAFTARLPIDFSKPAPAIEVPALERPTDEVLKKILEETKTVAVVGASTKEGRPAFTVPRYLARHGYTVIAVNPTLEGEAFGQPAVATLADLADKPDLVLVFRKSEHASGIVGDAIAAGTKVVWMQEGVMDESAGQHARQAGLQVVMDLCMRKTHARLFAS
jgi:signal transduction histidine kinase/predicted CoA-binding protein